MLTLAHNRGVHTQDEERKQSTSATPAFRDAQKGSQNAIGFAWEQSIEEQPALIGGPASSQKQVISCTAGGGVVVVEVVLVEVLVDVLVDVLVKQLAHLPLQSQGWFSRWNQRRLLLTHRVSALAKSHAPVSRSKGTWQTRTQSSSPFHAFGMLLLPPGMSDLVGVRHARSYAVLYEVSVSIC